MSNYDNVPSARGRVPSPSVWPVGRYHAERRPRWSSQTLRRISSLLLLLGLGWPADATGQADARSRPLWTTSRVIGSPEPPPPYTVEKVFANYAWRSPIYAVAEPGRNEVWVVQQGGEADRPSTVLRRSDELTSDEEPTLVLQLAGRLIYGLTFHPRYQDNGYVYVFSNGPTGAEHRFNRISRFTVDLSGMRACKPESELSVIEWPSMGHDGGDLAFGRDGMLYITSGDGTSDSDGWRTGQDLRDLAGGVLRIDVDHPSTGQAYSVPADNPFVNIAGARPEIWAFGLRNPWRMSVDSQTGHIWVGNNGQDLWETVHWLRRGENYGWSVFEGNHPFHGLAPLGPTPPVPPTLEHAHSEARSLTGGVVVYGLNLPELEGAYVYGDYSTGKIWGARHDGQQVVWHQELADTSLQIAGFALLRQGELIVVDHAGGLYRLVKSPPATSSPATSPADFPRRLSDTGLFADVASLMPQPGVIPYRVNSPGWHDGATSEYHLALPGDSKIQYAERRAWELPEGAVLVQTLSLGTTHDLANAETIDPPGQRIETRLLTKQQGEWQGYTYRWNDRQDDAELVPTTGENLPLPRADGSHAMWHIPSRAECMACHSRAVGFLLTMSAAQQNGSAQKLTALSPGAQRLTDLGVLAGYSADSQADSWLVNPYDASQPLARRARSYLHTNCAGCHVEAGGGNARMELEWDRELDSMNIMEVRPLHDTLGIENAMLVAPGEPERSMLYQRISRRGRGQMPPLVSQHVDERGVELMYAWIDSLPPAHPLVQHWQMADLLPLLNQVNELGSAESGQKLYRRLGCAQCHRFKGEGGGAGPELDEITQRLTSTELLRALLEPSEKVAPEFAMSVIETVSGEVIQGRLVEQDERQIVVQTVSSFAQRRTVPRPEIESLTPSSVSLMPAGMLDTLQVAEIWDLLAYLRDRSAKPDR